jgi:hypothetical protein
LQTKSRKKLFNVTVKFENGGTKLVKVKALDEEQAKERALKFNPAAVEAKI